MKVHEIEKLSYRVHHGGVRGIQTHGDGHVGVVGSGRVQSGDTAESSVVLGAQQLARIARSMSAQTANKRQRGCNNCMFFLKNWDYAASYLLIPSIDLLFWYLFRVTYGQ